MADTADSKSAGLTGREGSSPSSPTKLPIATNSAMPVSKETVVNLADARLGWQRDGGGEQAMASKRRECQRLKRSQKVD